MMKRELIEKALETACKYHDRAMTLADMDAALDSLCEVAVAELLGGGDGAAAGSGQAQAEENGGPQGAQSANRGDAGYPGGEKGAFRARQGPEGRPEAVRRRSCQN